MDVPSRPWVITWCSANTLRWRARPASVKAIGGGSSPAAAGPSPWPGGPWPLAHISWDSRGAPRRAGAGGGRAVAVAGGAVAARGRLLVRRGRAGQVGGGLRPARDRIGLQQRVGERPRLAVDLGRRRLRGDRLLQIAGPGHQPVA